MFLLIILLVIYTMIGVVAYYFLNGVFPYDLDDVFPVIRAIFWPISLIVFLIWFVGNVCGDLMAIKAINALGKQLHRRVYRERSYWDGDW